MFLKVFRHIDGFVTIFYADSATFLGQYLIASTYKADGSYKMNQYSTLVQVISGLLHKTGLLPFSATAQNRHPKRNTGLLTLHPSCGMLENVQTKANNSNINFY